METKQTYQPILLARRGEYTAWSLFGASVVGLAFFMLTGNVPWGAYVFVGFLFFAAGSISLGNLIDRKTTLSMDAMGISFENGLRHSSMDWGQVKEVRVIQGQTAKTVQVLADKTHFEFKMLSALKHNGEARAWSGFADGEDILKSIISAAGLKQEESNNFFARYVRVI